jgi:hypothetical protein
MREPPKELLDALDEVPRCSGCDEYPEDEATDRCRECQLAAEVIVEQQENAKLRAEVERLRTALDTVDSLTEEAASKAISVDQWAEAVRGTCHAALEKKL